MAERSGRLCSSERSGELCRKLRSEGLSRAERVRGKNRIDSIFREGTAGFVYPFRYVYTATDDDSAEVAILVSVSKRYHKRAVKRNLLKRRTREAYRKGKAGLRRQAVGAGKKIDIALIYSTSKIEEYKTIENAVARILAQIGENI